MIIHHRSHWIAVAVVAALGLLALEAAGQTTGAGAMFEGRPALAGAQAGQGAQAGPAQGGIGLQGSDGAEMNLRAPRIIREERAVAIASCEQGPTVSAAENPACLPQVADERLERRLAVLGIDPQQRGRM
jgi:hypothetical protein